MALEFPKRLSGWELVRHWLLPSAVSVILNLLILFSTQWMAQRPVYLPALEIQMIATATPEAKPEVKKPPKPQVKKTKPKKKPKKKKPKPPKPKLPPSLPKKPPEPQEPEPVEAVEPEPVEPEPVETVAEEPAVEQPPAKAAVLYNPQPLHLLSREPSGKIEKEPEYPPEERALGREAEVLVSFIITHEGRAVEIKIVKSGGIRFDNAVIEALKDNLFNPGYRDGQPVDVLVTRLFNFKLK